MTNLRSIFIHLCVANIPSLAKAFVAYSNKAFATGSHGIIGSWYSSSLFSSSTPSQSSPSSSSSSISSSSSSTTLKTNRKKSNMKKFSGDKKNYRKSSTPISRQELAEHVTSEYIHGKNGLARFNQQLQQFAQTSAVSAQQQQQQQQRVPDDETKCLDHHPALVLNADFQPLSYLPLSVWHWQEAIKSVFSGKVTVVEVYPDVTIRAARLQVPLPSVIALTEYVHSAQHQHHKPAFTKRNVFLRDEYRCQYCGGIFHTNDLSLDHVIPRCRGGHLSWENVVTCCTSCNGKKGSLGLTEIRSKWGMKLRTEPRAPTQYELALAASRMVLPSRRHKKLHPAWEPYLMLLPSKSTYSQLEEEEEDAYVGK